MPTDSATRISRLQVVSLICTLALPLALLSCASDAHPVLFIQLIPDSPTIAEIGMQTQFIATAQLEHGSVSDVTRTVTWASSSPNIATVNSSGLVTAVACGNTTITAEQGSVVGQTNLQVACTIPDRVELDVVKTGPTSARITSSPVGIDCGDPSLGQSSCDVLMDKGTGIVLTSTPPPTSWTNCDQVIAGSCALTLLPDPACTASQPCRMVTANY